MITIEFNNKDEDTLRGLADYLGTNCTDAVRQAISHYISDAIGADSFESAELRRSVRHYMVARDIR